MNVVHVSLTPVAGSPIRIVNALNSYTSVSARLVTLRPGAYGNRTFENDLVWDEDKDEALSLIDSAEIIHLHQYFDLTDNGFGIDFYQYKKMDKLLIRHYHSVPWHGGWSQSKILSEPLVKLVIAQYPERYYPAAVVVPNIVPTNAPLYLPANKEDPVRIFYSPSTLTSAWEDRWNTKGAPETKALLRRIKRKYGNLITIVIAQNIPHYECMRLRQSCHISIDELVTGSFHLSSLESLSQGIPTLAFLDDRVQKNLLELTGSSGTLPWVNVRIEDAEVALDKLIEDETYRSDIGYKSRQWMERYYSDDKIVQRFSEVYDSIMDGNIDYLSLRFDCSDKLSLWSVRGKADHDWVVRKMKFAPPQFIIELKKIFRKIHARGLSVLKRLTFDRYFK